MMKKKKKGQACLVFRIGSFENIAQPRRAHNTEHISIWSQIKNVKRERTDRDKNAGDCFESILCRRKLCYLRFLRIFAKRVKNLVIFKWYWHLIWWTKCLADWQEGFRPWHRSPQMSAMMTLNFAKWEKKTLLLLPPAPFFPPYVQHTLHFPWVTSRWQSCYPDPGVWGCTPAGWVLDCSGFNYV